MEKVSENSLDMPLHLVSIFYSCMIVFPLSLELLPYTFFIISSYFFYPDRICTHIFTRIWGAFFTVSVFLFSRLLTFSPCLHIYITPWEFRGNGWGRVIDKGRWNLPFSSTHEGKSTSVYTCNLNKGQESTRVGWRLDSR